MAIIPNKLIHFKYKSDFELRVNSSIEYPEETRPHHGDILDSSIVFIQDAKQIWTHGTYYDANNTSGVSTTQLVIAATTGTPTILEAIGGNWEKFVTAFNNSGVVIDFTNNIYTSFIGNISNNTVYLYTFVNENNKIRYIQITNNGTTETPNLTGDTGTIDLYNIITGYSENGDNFALKTNNQNQGFVTVPLSDYLSLAGGTMTGPISFENSLNTEVFEVGIDNTNRPYLGIEQSALKDSFSIKFLNNGESLGIILDISPNGIQMQDSENNGFNFMFGNTTLPTYTTNGNERTFAFSGNIKSSDVSSLAGYSQGSSTTTLNTSMTLNAALASLQNQINQSGSINSSNSTAKLYLIGGTSQASTGVTTYSNSEVYTQSGQVYASRMNALNGFYETSDARLKEFGDDVNALEVISNIPTKYFTWKSDEKQETHIGTSAQEIQKLFPDLVTADENGVLSVDYARLSIIAIAAIKELKKEIDELKNK